MKVTLATLASLLPTEHFDPDRLAVVREKILRDGVWTDPLKVERTDLLVMDGHHRLRAAYQIGLYFIPVVLLTYDQVGLFSRRPEFLVTPDKIRTRGKTGNLYPPKTTRHEFGDLVISCAIPLDRLLDEPANHRSIVREQDPSFTNLTRGSLKAVTDTRFSPVTQNYRAGKGI